jgi:replication factor C small subunit
VHKDIIGREKISMRDKVRLVDRIGEYEFRMVEGASDRIQLEALLAYLAISGKDTDTK